MRPDQNEYPEWYAGYVQSVPDGNILTIMQNQLDDVLKILSGISAGKEKYSYAPGKWTVKELLGHINDAERIFSYRSLRFIRKDSANLPQYDHDKYVVEGNFNSVPFNDLKNEFEFLRRANIILFKNLKEDDWKFKGLSGGKEFTVLALAYIMTGHAAHHMQILKERYLSPPLE